MNFPFLKVVRRTAPQPPRSHKSGLKASWSRDPKSGRLTQSWRSADDGERSCMRRPARPPAPLPQAARWAA